MPLVLVLVAGAVLWYAHAISWDLGGRSPILSYDSAQYALAARELAWHGHLATPFAVPLDLAWPGPPWKLSALQPGLVLVEGAIFRLVPARGATAGSDPRAWLTLILPFTSYLMLGASAVLGTRHLLARAVPDAPRWIKAGAPATLGLMVLLDTEAQHFALSGLNEMPFTVLYLAALFGLARGAGVAYPLVYGLLLGVAGLFRANMLWLAPLFALGSAWCAPPGRRRRVALGVLAGFALPLAPWWIYKWRAFGSPGWDLDRYMLWDQVQGRSWFELDHRAELPDVPRGLEALRLLLAKVAGNLPRLGPTLLNGPRGLWLGALVAWLCTRPSRPFFAAGVVALAALALNLFAACASIPWIRYLFPARIAAEAAGLLALWALLQRIPGATSRSRAWACGAAAVLALAWGTWQTRAVHAEALSTSRERGVPASTTLTALSITLNEVLTPGEPLMSNLGPALAWQTNHPVIHLAYAPEDVPGCRRRRDFRHIVLAFRNTERAWPEWQEVMGRPGTAQLMKELSVRHERRYKTSDGFVIVWLELGPMPAGYAAVPAAVPAPALVARR